MKQIEQTIFGEKGNCFSACVASILELDDVPNFVEFGDTWLSHLEIWLSPMNLGVIYVEGHRAPPGYSILSRVAKSGRRHCVVCRNGDVAWDPSPFKVKFLESPLWWLIFTVKDPTKPIILPCTSK